MFLLKVFGLLFPVFSVCAVTYPEPKGKVLTRAMGDALSGLDAENTAERMKNFWYDDMVWDGPVGYGNFTGLDGWLAGEHYPFRRSFNNTIFNSYFFVGDGDITTMATYENVIWVKDCQGIPPTHKPAIFRSIDFWFAETRGSEYKLYYNWVLFDMLLMMYQAGVWVLPVPEAELKLKQFYLAPPASLDGWPAPNSWEQDPQVTARTRVVINRFFDSLNTNHHSIEDLFHFVHYDVKFYGPVGIGFADNLQDFHSEFIEKLFEGFSEVKFVGPFEPLVEGNYAGVFCEMRGRHTGPYLGHSATGKSIYYRMSFHFRLEDAKIKEVYLVSDIPELFLQFGVDLFKKMEKIVNSGDNP